MGIIYKLDTYGIVKFLGINLILTALAGIIVTFFKDVESIPFSFMVIVGISLFFFSFIYELSIYLNYYFINKSTVMEWFPEKREVLIIRKRKKKVFSIDDIQNVLKVQSFPFSENRISVFSSDKYNYSIISLYSGNKFIVTSLLVPRLDLFLPPDKITIKRKFICWIDKKTRNLSDLS